LAGIQLLQLSAWHLDVKGSVEMNAEEIWLDGFNSGEQFNKECPYEKGTEESKLWLSGWLEGAAKKSGSPYSKSLEEKSLGIQHNA
jgi:ribosome modulation factor